MERSTGRHCWDLQKVIDRDSTAVALYEIPLHQPFPCTLKPAEFLMDYGMEPLGALGNEADHFQWMCAIKKQLKYNELASSEMRNTMSGNTVA